MIDLSVSLPQSALLLKDRYETSYWDAAILATATIASCEELFSENLNPEQSYGSVLVVNPFFSPIKI